MTIGISIGDPNGIGPEVVLKTFSDAKLLSACTSVVYAHVDFVAQQANHFNLQLPIERLHGQPKHGVLNVVDCWSESFQPQYGTVDAKAGACAVKSLQAASKALQQGTIDALVTAPIHKAAIQSEAFNFPGHTDFLAQEFDGQALMFLVHADLRDADLKGAALQRANLGQARLDGANLKGADLSFTSLNGASLRGADLRGSRLYGTDLRNSDLSGAQLDPGSLEQSHWQGAQGISQGVRSHASLHNAGVSAAENGHWKQAEKLFSAAIIAEPNEPLSWVARGLSRGELGDTNGASRDLAHAGKLFGEQGDQEKEVQLKEASQKATANLADPALRGGNGIGSQLLSGALSTAHRWPLAFAHLLRSPLSARPGGAVYTAAAPANNGAGESSTTTQCVT